MNNEQRARDPDLDSGTSFPGAKSPNPDVCGVKCHRRVQGPSRGPQEFGDLHLLLSFRPTTPRKPKGNKHGPDRDGGEGSIPFRSSFFFFSSWGER